MLRRARRGDMKAHEVLYRSYGGPVYTLATRLLGDRSMADEVLQETSIEVIRHLRTFREDAAFGGWVKRIATNKCLALLRSAWHRKSRSLEGLSPIDEDPEGPAGGATSEDLPGRLGEQQRLERALATLSPTARAVVWLYDVEGHSHEEIARMMGKTVSFSKSRLSRAHEQLRTVLGQDTDEVEACTQQPNSC
jgi:RNA polymerase sigma-70 factor (ECF subfamily)